MSLRQTWSEFRPPKPSFTEADLPSLAGKTYLVTGGAAGIGKELVRILYAANATVYVAGRSLANIEKAAEEIKGQPAAKQDPTPPSCSIIPLILDLSDLTTIKPAVQKLEQTTTKLDAVFFNAGVMVPPAGSKTVQGYELQWGTNVVGHFLLQKLLMPLLLETSKQTGEVRIIWTSSDASNSSPAPDGVSWQNINGDKPRLGQFKLYSQSKGGNVILAAETARRYGAEGVVTASLNPGHLKTELQRHIPAIVTRLLGAIILYEPRYGALTELYAGFSKDVNKENNGGYLIPWGRAGMMAAHIKKGLENGSGQRLWDMLEKETATYA